MHTRMIAAMLMSVIGLAAVADTETVGNIVWTYDKSDGAATITDAKTTSGTKVSGDIEIPGTLGGVSVENIGDRWYSGVFSECTGIHSVVIPGSVKLIGERTFYGCTGMKTITFGQNVETVDDYAFYGCTGLQNVSLPNGVKTIGNSAFSGCTGLRVIDIPDGVVSIGDSAFRECAVLQTIDLPDSIQEIGAYAFYDCGAATRLHIPASLAGILDYTFCGCSSIVSVSIPDNVASIATYAFASCSELQEVIVSKNVVSIGYGAFGEYVFSNTNSGCPNLSRVIFRGDAPTMADEVFRYYDNGNYHYPNCTAYVRRSSTGWGVSIPGTWEGIKIAYWDNTIVFPRTVTFNADGGTFVTGNSRRTVNEGIPIGTLPEVTRTDYDFLGWYTQPENGERVTEDRIIENDLTCYARWSLISPPVSLDFIQRTVPAGTSQKFTATARLEDGSDRVVAATWQIVGDGSFGSITSDGMFTAAETTVEGSVMVQATYTSRGKTVTSAAKTIWISPRSVTVEFVGEGGTPSFSQGTFTVYGTYGTLPSATRDGYWFDGWFTSSGVGGVEITEDTRVAGGVERLYAHWRKHQPVAFYIGGEDTVLAGESLHFAPSVVMDSGETNFVDVVWEIVSGSNFVERIDADGAMFAACTPESGEVVIRATYEADGRVLSDSKTVYVEMKTVLVSFDGNGGETPDPRTYAVYGPYGSLPYSVRDGYAFGGWWTALGGGLEIGTNSIVESSISNLFAYWLPCWVTFDANGGVGEMTPQSFVGQKTQMLKANAFARSGYVFLGWAASQDGDVIWADRAQITVDAPITLYAVWGTLYNVTYQMGSHAAGTQQRATKTNDVELVLAGALFTRTGYTQMGWATSDEGELVYGLGATYSDNASVVLYPVWTANICVLTFDPGEGAATYATREVAFDDKIGGLPTGFRDGYICAGWFTDKAGGSKVYAGTIVKGDATYYAHWTPRQYQVVFDANGGIGGTSDKQDCGSPISPPAVTRDGFTFMGWDPQIDDCVPPHDVRYAAQWKLNEYVLKLNLGGGDGENEIVASHGTHIGDIPVPTRHLFRFAGWFTAESGGDRLDEADTVTCSTELFAHWERTAYIVAFDANGGNAEEIERTVDANGSIGELPNATMIGSVLVGWFTAADAGVRINASFAVDEDMTLYAHWIPTDQIRIEVDESYDTDADGSFALDMSQIVVSASTPTVKVSGLPAGLTYDGKKMKIGGKATKPGVYYVTVSAQSKTVQNAVSKTFAIRVPNWVDGVIPVADSYGPFIPGVFYTNTIMAAEGCTVTGLPAGMKWTAKDIVDRKTKKVVIPANTFYGASTKPGNSTVTFSKVVKDGAKSVKHMATATFIVAPLRKLTVESSGAGTGKVTGAGFYAANAKVSLKATADTKNAPATSGKSETVKSVFSGWYDGVELISRAAAFQYIMPEENVVLSAVFITASEDAANLSTVVNMGGEEVLFAENGSFYATNVMSGVYLEWPIVVEARSLSTVKVSGLPAGLKFTAKDILDPATKRVAVPANTIYGAPTAASKKDKNGVAKPSTVKISVTTAGKSKGEYRLDMVVNPLPVWIVGEYSGECRVESGELAGTVAFAVASTGKISGKMLVDGKAWTLSAASFGEVVSSKPTCHGGEDQGRVYIATVLAKSGKEVVTNEVVFAAETIVSPTGGDVVRGVMSGETVAMYARPFQLFAWQNLWKAASWSDLAKNIAKAPQLPVETAAGKVTLKFGSSGVVTAKLDRYSCSSVLIPAAVETGVSNFYVYLYFPEKAGKFAGYVDGFRVIWAGSAFEVQTKD